MQQAPLKAPNILFSLILTKTLRNGHCNYHHFTVKNYNNSAKLELQHSKGGQHPVPHPTSLSWQASALFPFSIQSPQSFACLHPEI